MYKFTAAHKSLPLPTYVRVTNLENSRSLIVRVNDRGPFHGDRIIDLSYAAAVRLGVDVQGTARVEVQTVTPESSAASGPITAAARPSGGQRWLQVGSFAEQNNASRVLKQLDEAGLYDHRLQRVEVAGRTVWRAQAGPFRNDSELQKAEDRIRSLGLGVPQVVRD
jgi:rare lipoprotein A